VTAGEDTRDAAPALARKGLPAGARVAIFGSGASVPGRQLHGTLVDFDARLLDTARSGGRFTTHLGIGIRTPLPDRAVDRVVITSRLAGPLGCRTTRRAGLSLLLGVSHDQEVLLQL
jgi:hypothetical protein